MTIPAKLAVHAKQSSQEYLQDGRSFAVKDIKDRLIQDADSSTLLLWPPNLFAFTSYILNLSGAYQLVVSPPPGDDRLYHWPPTPGLFHQLLRYFREVPPDPFRYSRAVIDTLVSTLDSELDFAAVALPYLIDHTSDTYNMWTYLVRKSALEWRFSFEQMTKHSWSTFSRRFPVMREETEPLSDEILKAIHSLPPLLHACWIVFTHVYSLHGSESPSLTVSNLLCNSNTDGLGAQKRRSAWLGAVSLLTMHAIADDACVGWGILENAGLDVDFPSQSTIAALRAANRKAKANGVALVYPEFRLANVKNSPAQRAAAKDLRNRHTMATIAESRARILPKRHNPDVGITLRSLSSNLAFHRSPIEISWDRDGKSPLAERLSKKTSQLKPVDRLPRSEATARHRRKVYDSFTMLLLPFPMQIHTNDFQEVDEGVDHDALDNREGYGFFRYVQQRNTGPRVEDILEVIRQARLEETTVDMIVLPESALDDRAFERLK